MAKSIALGVKLFWRGATTYNRVDENGKNGIEELILN